MRNTGLYEFARAESNRAFAAASVIHYAQELLRLLEVELDAGTLDQRLVAMHLQESINDFFKSPVTASERP